MVKLIISCIVSATLLCGVVFYCMHEDFRKEVHDVLECFCRKLRDGGVHEHIAEHLDCVRK
ncbi:hypothetical protein [Candidatus Spyradosoma sp. SGI.093]|uniref:hypothetical protein n=1 Tax=Candidatus Spyradosoma sp. SGI.093 TaxID=3420583 RepID=UPI003D02B9CC